MGYLIYLAGLTIFVLCGVGLNKISNFIDVISLGFVVIPCILVLISMGYWKGFLRAFIHILNKESRGKEEIKSSRKAVKLTCVCSLVFGALGVVVSMINLMKSADLTYTSANVGADVSVALISIFYALIINAVLIPLYFKLKD